MNSFIHTLMLSTTGDLHLRDIIKAKAIHPIGRRRKVADRESAIGYMGNWVWELGLGFHAKSRMEETHGTVGSTLS